MSNANQIINKEGPATLQAAIESDWNVQIGVEVLWSRNNHFEDWRRAVNTLHGAAMVTEGSVRSELSFLSDLAGVLALMDLKQ